MRPFSPSVVYETGKSYFAIRHLLLTFYWISQKLVSKIRDDARGRRSMTAPRRRISGAPSACSPLRSARNWPTSISG
jgi:hypothetical protein